ncbi:MAG: hypothetical protein A2X56_06980 [Nitrospirae bacterium GWC2_57_13]|jgi:hypothetical protein|nr:MAG: hypothetical protein A2X56_06980 [Nitrospirae bacterium GWC2_57_13]OGW43600.1 MAG: hypothetical protein A2X57_04580 [Nitrospirae bacterium GWD2_57_8]
MDKEIPIGEFPKCTEDDQARRKKFSSGHPSFGHLSWARKKGDKKTLNSICTGTNRDQISDVDRYVTNEDFILPL